MLNRGGKVTEFSMKLDPWNGYYLQLKTPFFHGSIHLVKLKNLLYLKGLIRKK